MTDHRHTIHWYQPDNENITGWEFEYLPGGPAHRPKIWEPAGQTNTVQSCNDCFEVELELPGAVALVRARSIGEGGEISHWGSPVNVPEPSIAIMLTVSIVFLAFIYSKSRRTSR